MHNMKFKQSLNQVIFAMVIIVDPEMRFLYHEVGNLSYLVYYRQDCRGCI